jgi:hypothetical protein
MSAFNGFEAVYLGDKERLASALLGENKLLNPAWIFHELLAPTTDMAILPGVLGCRPLRRTVQVRLETNPAVPRDELPGGTPI